MAERGKDARQSGAGYISEAPFFSGSRSGTSAEDEYIERPVRESRSVESESDYYYVAVSKAIKLHVYIMYIASSRKPQMLSAYPLLFLEGTVYINIIQCVNMYMYK